MGHAILKESVPSEHYHADDSAISSSDLKKILISPAHFLWHKANPSESTADQQFGTAVHTALLEPERFKRDYICGIDVRKNTNEWKQFVAEHHGKAILNLDDYRAIRLIRENIERRDNAKLLLSDPVGKPEQSIYWQDEKTGVNCKCRPDRLLPYTIVDIKTAKRGDAKGFAKQIYELDYHLSAAFYSDGVRELTGETLPFVFMVIEKETWEVVLYQPSEMMLEKGRLRYQQALATIAKCYETNRWPGYQPAGNIDLIDLPRYAT